MTRAAAHAIEDYPREACGLVVVIRGRQRYMRATNQAEGADGFRMAPADYAMAEDMGEIVAVVHSHPDATAAPSDHDRVACEASGLPWFIVSVRQVDVRIVADTGNAVELDASEWARIDPCGYRLPLVGRTFSHGTVDCYALIRDWYRDERGVELPDFARADDWWLHGGNLYVDHFAEAGFRRLGPGEQPEVGDVFLAQIRSAVPNHGGVYVGDGIVIHHLHGRLSSRDVFGGYLAECTTHWLRYAGTDNA